MNKSKIFALCLLLLATCVFFSGFLFGQDATGQKTEKSAQPAKSDSDTDAIAFTPVLSSDVLDILPEPVRDFMKFTIFGYPLWRIVLTVTILIAGFFLERLINAIFKKSIEKVKARKVEDKKLHFLRSTFLSTRRPARFLIWAGLIRLVGFIILQEHAAFAIWVTDLLISLAIVLFIYDFVEVLEEFLMGFVKKTETKVDDMIVPIIRNGLRIIVIALAVIHMVQQVTKQDITSIIAGLGIAGMAVALAAQDTIKNLFGFVMIALDQPFKVGERINFDDHDGIIEEIGIRSTKMRRLDGHVVTIPNMKAADGVIWNIGRRENIRRIMNIGITYGTKPEKIQEAVEILKDILKDHEGMKAPLLPEVYFNEMNADNLNIFAIYWYHPPAYWDYMKHSEWVNLEIIKRFNTAGIDFAFPTQTVQVQMDPEQLQLISRMEQQAKRK
ncbi:MAG: mechanosensitive ion channel family protein [Spirochaetales bacterium]|nr:mechanosensitive ion channel family protein [Spirochaetales bacterium]